MNKQFKYIILIFSITSISFIFYFVFNAFQIRENTIQKVKENENQDTTIILKNGIYALELQTIIFDDTLSEKWVEYGFLSPFILNQYLIFYKNGKMIKKYELPIKKVIKETSKYKNMAFISVPIFEICLLEGNNIEVYEVSGSNYCCGLMCPEFLGLYSMEGKMISECIAAKKYFSGEDISNFLARHKIDLNKPVACNSIFDIFTIEE